MLLQQDLLSPGGQVWELHPTGPAVDARPAASKRLKAKRRMHNPDLDIKEASAFDFWWSLFPPDFMAVLLRGTEATRKRQPPQSQLSEFKKPEVLQTIGLLYGNCLHPTGDIFDMFNESGRHDADDLFFEPSNISHHLIWFALHVIVNSRLTASNCTYVYIAFLNTFETHHDF